MLLPVHRLGRIKPNDRQLSCRTDGSITPERMAGFDRTIRESRKTDSPGRRVAGTIQRSGSYLFGMSMQRFIGPGVSTVFDLLLAGPGAVAQTLTAEQIMARVAQLQDQAQAERTHYVYVQHAKVVSQQGRTIHCEETTDYRVVPTGKGEQMKLLDLEGRYRSHGHIVDYSALPPTQGKVEGAAGAAAVPISGDEIDVDMMEDMRDSFLDAEAKDGIDAHLFPLTTKEQAGYSFRLARQEELNGRRVYHIEFRPSDPHEFRWKGDAWIDTVTFEPVVVSSLMSRKIPLAIRTVLGTNVPGFGFTVVYAPQAGGVWFPVSFSTEFEIHVLFFFRRTIVIDAQNRDFEQTHVTTRIVGPGEVADKQ
jgi:hypothetical protein